jgi:hypothetical protein
MKIYEIISENNLSEANPLGKIFAKIGSKALSKGEAADLLAQAYRVQAAQALKAGKNLVIKGSDAVNHVDAKYANDPNFLTNAAERAIKLGKEDLDTANKATVSTAAHGALDTVGGISQTAYTALQIYEFGKPIYDYNKNVTAAKAEMDAGRMTQAQFSAARQAEFADLVKRLVALGLCSTVRIPFAWINSFCTRSSVLSKSIGMLSSGAGKTLQIAAERWFNTPGMEASITAILVGGSGNDVGNWFETVVGGVGVGALDNLKSYLAKATGIKVGVDQDKFNPKVPPTQTGQTATPNAAVTSVSPQAPNATNQQVAPTDDEGPGGVGPYGVHR